MTVTYKILTNIRYLCLLSRTPSGPHHRAFGNLAESFQPELGVARRHLGGAGRVISDGADFSW